MSENIYCPTCGKSIEDESSFCQSCGAHLGKEEVKVEQPIYQPIQPQPQQVVIQQYVVKETNTMADTSLVFAILSFTFLPFIAGIVAIITGFIALMNPYKRRQATIALVLGFVNVIGIPLVWLIIFLVTFRI